MTQIVVLADYPMSPVWLRYLQLDRVAGEYSVLFVEISISGPQAQAFRNGLPAKIPGHVEHLRITHVAQLLVLAARVKSAIIVDLTVSALACYAMANFLFRRGGGAYVKFIIGILPPVARNGQGRRRAALFSPKRWWWAGSVLRTRFILQLLRYDHTVLGGEAALDLLPAHPGALIKGASFDYLDFIRMSESAIGDSGFAVLIEENLIDDSDFLLTGCNPGANAEVYSRSLVALLGYVARKTGMPVKVLPHPKSNLEVLRRRLPGYEFLSEGAVSAISRASFVVAHISTALSFALLAKKPILLLDCAGLERNVIHRMECTAATLGISPVRPMDLEGEGGIDLQEYVPSEALRVAYIDNYIRSPDASLVDFPEIMAQILAARYPAGHSNARI